MMFNKITIAFWLISIIYNVNAQTGQQEIQFEKNLSWQQIKFKASAENKYIFLDFYATWCGPCKQMEKDVYTNDTIADYFNQHFISVKLQTDQTGKDDAYTRSWYNDAKAIAKQYKVLALPTYVFLSPDGELVQFDKGFKPVPEFLQLAQAATALGHQYKNPYQRYDEAIAAYREGKKEYAAMPYLINVADTLKDKTLQDSLTQDYMQYLASRPQREVYTKENLTFIAAHLQEMKSKFLSVFYPNGKKADAIIGQPGFASDMVDKLIRQELVNPFLTKAEGGPEPDWKLLTTSIKAKYPAPAYAHRNTLAAQVKWYEFYQQWQQYTQSFIELHKTYGIDSTDMGDMHMNSFCWDMLFLRDATPEQLRLGIKWMEGVARRVQCNPQGAYIDTYANLLYKAGITQQAICQEERAVQNAITNNAPPGYLNEWKTALDKMRRGEPTWITQ